MNIINPLLDEVIYAGAFDELAEESDLYTKKDLKITYIR
jgi:hypothetical protein